MGIRPLPRLVPGDLVACALPPSDAWTALLREAWDAGAAVLPVDSRSPAAETRTLMERASPTVVVSENGVRRVGGTPAPDGVAVVVATSGSTGAPRLVELTRDAVSDAVRASAVSLAAAVDDAWLCCLPVAHIGGLLVLLRHIVAGVPVAVHAGFSVEAVRSASETRFLSVVPTQLRRLFAGGVDCTRFKAILVGGAALPEQLQAEALQRGVKAVPTYGLTESCGGVVYSGSPLAGTSVRIAGDGGVELHGPTLMRGYRFDAAATAQAFTRDGWLRTRDAGEIVDGRLHVLGRLDEAIVSGGEKVWPQEVEAALASHPQVAEVAVSGRPDAEWGSRVVAFVVPRDRHTPPTLESLRAHVGERLARYKAPRELVTVGSLPRTALGKVRRDLLAR